MVTYELNINEEVQNVIKELAMQNKAYKDRLQKAKVVFSILGTVFVVVSMFYFMKVESKLYVGIFLALAAFCYFYGFYGLKKMYSKNLDKMIKSTNKEMFMGIRKYTFDADGVQIISNMGEGCTKWNAFKDWGTYSHYLYMRRMDGALILVDKNEVSEQDISEIVGQLENSKNEVNV